MLDILGILEITPPSPETVHEAMNLLPKIPKIWATVPQLSHLEAKALGLLVACGLAERKVSGRIRRVGDKRIVSVVFRFTGQAGFAQALDPAFDEAWHLWGANWKARKIYWELCDGEGNWRLTDQGELALQYFAPGDKEEFTHLWNFLRTPGMPLAEHMPPPFRFVPGVSRPVVCGAGYSESVKVVNTDTEPMPVKVVNPLEVIGLAELTQVIQETIRRTPEDRLIAVRKKVNEKVSAFLKENPSAPMKEVCAHLDKVCPRAGKKKWKPGKYLTNLPAWQDEMDRRSGLFKSRGQKEGLLSDVAADGVTASGNPAKADRDSVLSDLVRSEDLEKLSRYLFENPRASLAEACTNTGITSATDIPQDQWEQLKACLIDSYKDKMKEARPVHRRTGKKRKKPNL